MSIEKKTKLNYLLTNWQDGQIFTSTWFHQHGYSPALVQKYKSGKWIEALGSGAYKKKGDTVEWSGAVACIQSQLQLKVHVGGKSALELLGKAQYLKLGNDQILLLGEKKELLPAWMKKYRWKTELKYQTKNLFEIPANSFGAKEAGFTTIEVDSSSFIASAAERAFLEYLDELPKKYSYQEAKEILENLTSLRSGVLQYLLEKCTSLKVKRLFLHLAEQVRHPWQEKLEISKIKLGAGKREIFKNGILDLKYNITVPRDESHEAI